VRGRSASATTPAPPAAAEHARRGSGGLPPRASADDRRPAGPERLREGAPQVRRVGRRAYRWRALDLGGGPACSWPSGGGRDHPPPRPPGPPPATPVTPPSPTPARSRGSGRHRFESPRPTATSRSATEAVSSQRTERPGADALAAPRSPLRRRHPAGLAIARASRAATITASARGRTGAAVVRAHGIRRLRYRLPRTLSVGTTVEADSIDTLTNGTTPRSSRSRCIGRSGLTTGTRSGRSGSPRTTWEWRGSPSAARTGSRSEPWCGSWPPFRPASARRRGALLLMPAGDGGTAAPPDRHPHWRPHRGPKPDCPHHPPARRQLRRGRERQSQHRRRPRRLGSVPGPHRRSPLRLMAPPARRPAHDFGGAGRRLLPLATGPTWIEGALPGTAVPAAGSERC